MKKLLYINQKDRAKLRTVRSVAILQRIRLEEIPEEEVRELPENAEMMRMSGFTGEEMRQFLGALRRNGVTVDLKCVETETNREWRLKRLYEELLEEHTTMNNRKEQ
jgi:hypothetical protein